MDCLRCGFEIADGSSHEQVGVDGGRIHALSMCYALVADDRTNLRLTLATRQETIDSLAADNAMQTRELSELREQVELLSAKPEVMGSRE